MSEHEFTLQVTVRKRSDMEEPTNIDDAISMVKYLLSIGEFIEIVEVKQ